METPKYEQPNITIGEQEFQKVGNMNSEPTDLTHAPKNYDLYQDTESGALAGKLPEHHPSKSLTSEIEYKEIDAAYKVKEQEAAAIKKAFEQKIENLDIDLQRLSKEELLKLLSQKGNKMYGTLTFSVNDNADISFRSYMGLDLFGEGGRYKFSSELDSWCINERTGEDYMISEKGVNSENRGVCGVSGEYKSANFLQMNLADMSVPEKNKITLHLMQKSYFGGFILATPNSREDEKLVAVEFSFYEIPEGYKELMEKKEAGE